MRISDWSSDVCSSDLFDQRVALLDPARSVADNFLRLNPGTTNNQCRAALARFRFRAEAADRIAGTLSGGQLLRAGLAYTLGVKRRSKGTPDRRRRGTPF